MGRPRATLADAPDRFWRKVEKTDTCWLWRGEMITGGYGLFSPLGSYGKKVRAHRFSYELLVGPIPKGLTLDHLCRTRHCVNPAHLEPVTNRENIIRGNGWAGQKARQTHCVHGHPLSGENLWIHPRLGRRICLACKRNADKRYAATTRGREVRQRARKRYEERQRQLVSLTAQTEATS